MLKACQPGTWACICHLHPSVVSGHTARRLARAEGQILEREEATFR